MEATPSYEAVASGHARAAPKWGEAQRGTHLLRGGWPAPQIIPRIWGAWAWSMHGRVKPAKMLDTSKDQLDDWILGGWLGVQADPWDMTRMPRYAGGWLGAQGDQRDRTGMPRPMVPGALDAEGRSTRLAPQDLPVSGWGGISEWTLSGSSLPSLAPPRRGPTSDQPGAGGSGGSPCPGA